MFPTWSEVLEVLREPGLREALDGLSKLTPARGSESTVGHRPTRSRDGPAGPPLEPLTAGRTAYRESNSFVDKRSEPAWR